MDPNHQRSHPIHQDYGVPSLQVAASNLAQYRYFPRESLYPATAAAPSSGSQYRETSSGCPSLSSGSSEYGITSTRPSFQPPSEERGRREGSSLTSDIRSSQHLSGRTLASYPHMAPTSGSDRQRRYLDPPPMPAPISSIYRQPVYSSPYAEDSHTSESLQPSSRSYAASITSCVDSPMEARYPRFPTPTPMASPPRGIGTQHVSPLGSAATNLSDATLFLASSRNSVGEKRTVSSASHCLQVPAVTYGGRGRSMTLPNSRVAEAYDRREVRSWPDVDAYRQDVEADVETALGQKRRRVVNRLMSRLGQRDWDGTRGGLSAEEHREAVKRKGVGIAVVVGIIIAIIVIAAVAAVLGPKQKN